MSAGARGRRAADAFVVWNRRLHYYLGLYLLFFTWLFAFSGLLLNHPGWQFAQFWPNRSQTTTQHSIEVVTGSSDLERARGLMRQVGVAGEIQWPPAQPADGPFTFQVSRPGMIVNVRADLQAGRVTLERIRLNAWGVMHVLHTFTGTPSTDSRHGRDWLLTTVWALTMDAVALGLIVMVLSSYVMWYRLKTKRLAGAVALVLGLISCIVMVCGLGGLI